MPDSLPAPSGAPSSSTTPASSGGQPNPLIDSLQKWLLPCDPSGSPQKGSPPAGTWAIRFDPASKSLSVAVSVATAGTGSDGTPSNTLGPQTLYCTPLSSDDAKHLVQWLGLQMAQLPKPKPKGEPKTDHSPSTPKPPATLN